MGASLEAAQHAQRAEQHMAVAQPLAHDDGEWASVMWFYAAYHYVRAAMLRDAVWGDPARLHAIHHDLNAEDRHTSRHKGRRGRVKEWGVNELVLLLYPQIAGAYDRLHQASIMVRYGIGLAPGALPALVTSCEEVQDAYEQGRLTAQP